MKKILIYLLSTILMFAIASLSMPETVLATQSTLTTSDTVEGIKKIKKDTVNAVIIGDSIAASQGASNPLTTGWDSNLNTFLFKEFSNKILWDNKARSGTTVDYCLKRAKEIKSTTDAVFVCVGRNDRRVYTPDQFSKKYTRLIHNIKRKAPNADVFCIVEPPMNFQNESLFLGIRTAIIDVSYDTGSYVLDSWGPFPKGQMFLSDLLTDGLHPNDIGYETMSKYMFRQIYWLIDHDR